MSYWFILRNMRCCKVTYGIPNLLINGATCQTMNTFSRILHLTKYLIIDDSTILRKRTFLDLFYFLVKGVWFSETCSQFGLKLSHLSPDTILSSSLDFISSLQEVLGHIFQPIFIAFMIPFKSHATVQISFLTAKPML